MQPYKTLQHKFFMRQVSAIIQTINRFFCSNMSAKGFQKKFLMMAGIKSKLPPKNFTVSLLCHIQCTGNCEVAAGHWRRTQNLEIQFGAISLPTCRPSPYPTCSLLPTTLFSQFTLGTVKYILLIQNYIPAYR